MTLTELPARTVDGHRPTSTGNDDHPMRRMTRRAAGLADPPWGPDAVEEVQALFDSLAPEWHTRSSPERTEVVVDALDRGVSAVRGDDAPGAPGTAVEPGSGIGAYSALLADRFGRVVSVELSHEMLRLAPADVGGRVIGDASVLPVADGAADAVVLVNMFLFPAEVDRVLAPDGCVVWVNSSGEDTPIHLTPDEVVAALPGRWTGVHARAGAGLWAVVRRAR